MSNKTFTRAQLDERTSKDLKRMCIDELNIAGVSKKSKDEVINAILKNCGSEATKVQASPSTSQPLRGIEFNGQSVMSKPEARFGDRTSTTINVSCGASSGAFPVAGRTVKEVGEFLREVLNVDKISTGLVNGKDAAADYILKPGDSLEFLKPAGKKG